MDYMHTSNEQQQMWNQLRRDVNRILKPVVHLYSSQDADAEMDGVNYLNVDFVLRYEESEISSKRKHDRDEYECRDAQQIRPLRATTQRGKSHQRSVREHSALVIAGHVSSSGRKLDARPSLISYVKSLFGQFKF